MTEALTTADGMKLHAYRWLAPDQKATILLLHGYAEHCGRYQHVAEAFNSHGVSLVGADFRGHGHSGGTPGYVKRFSDYHQDIGTMFQMAKGVASEGPLAILGHCIGGLLACDWLLTESDREISGLILSSPYLGLALHVNPVKLALGKAISSLVPRVSLPSGLKGADVARDPEIAARYDSDPLVFSTANARWFTESTTAIDRVQAKAAALRVPLLMLYGGSDRVACADASDRFAGALTLSDKTAERLPGAYHEILNEPPKERAQIMKRMISWLLERTSKS